MLARDSELYRIHTGFKHRNLAVRVEHHNAHRGFSVVVGCNYLGKRILFAEFSVLPLAVYRKYRRGNVLGLNRVNAVGNIAVGVFCGEHDRIHAEFVEFYFVLFRGYTAESNAVYVGHRVAVGVGDRHGTGRARVENVRVVRGGKRHDRARFVSAAVNAADIDLGRNEVQRGFRGQRLTVN